MPTNAYKGVLLLKFDLPQSEWSSIFQKCDFTDDEKNIIALRRRGWRLSQIATELYLSERTVNRRISGISKKITSLHNSYMAH